jgi:protein-tyrosine phosphatase
LLILQPGNEVHIAHDLVEKTAEAKATPINQKRYILIEFASMNVPVGVDELFYRLQISGITPILVHPERNNQIQNQPSIVGELIKRGARIQVTAMSITGEFGVTARKSVEMFLNHNWVHFIATDTHRAKSSPPSFLPAGTQQRRSLVGMPRGVWLKAILEP